VVWGFYFTFQKPHGVLRFKLFLSHSARKIAGSRFTPYPYTPLYSYVSSLAARIMGVGFVPLRLVSFLSAIGCIVMIFRFVQRESGSI